MFIIGSLKGRIAQNYRKSYKEKLVCESLLPHYLFMKSVSPAHKKLGERIKKLRNKERMTQEDLAFKIGVDRSYMGFIERGERNPTLDKIKRLAKALNISLSELLKDV